MTFVATSGFWNIDANSNLLTFVYGMLVVCSMLGIWATSDFFIPCWFYKKRKK